MATNSKRKAIMIRDHQRAELLDRHTSASPAYPKPTLIQLLRSSLGSFAAMVSLGAPLPERV